MTVIDFDPKILSNYFDDFIRFLCRSCKRYNTKPTCPPNIETVEYYKQLVSKYNKGILIYKKYDIDNINDWKKLGHDSSLEIHNELEWIKYSIREYKQFPLLLGAGSCKYCLKCHIPCNYPDKAIVPLEATGINVIKLFKDLTDIDLKFPVEDHFYRIGMILWS